MSVLIAFSNQDYLIYSTDKESYIVVDDGRSVESDLIISSIAMNHSSIYGYEVEDMDCALDVYNLWKGLESKFIRARELNKQLKEHIAKRRVPA